MNVSFSTRAAFLSSTAMLLLAGTALAADLPRTTPPPPPPSPLTPAPVISWTGFYVGANAGWVGLDSQVTDVDGYGNCCSSIYDGETAKLNPSGGLFGGQVGYNVQSGALVGGIEADFDWASANSSESVWSGHTFSAGLNDLATVRLRGGVLVQPNFLLYLTGGYAGGDIKDTVHSSNPVIGGTSWSNGWTAGGGGEWALNNQWSVKAEALYVSFGDRTTTITGCCSSNYRFKFQNSAVVARVGVNLHF